MLTISLDDSSVYPDDPPPGGAKGNPSFRSFRANNTMILKNGETGQFTTATDKVRYVRGPAIEASDRLPDGRSFADVREFKRLVLTDPEAIASNVAAKLFTAA